MKYKILIADDEPDIIEILKYNLEKEGYEIFSAKNGNEAIDLSIKMLPDLIILDMMMPGKTGMQVCEFLRQQAIFKNTIIVFLTAVNDEISTLKSFDLGADDYINKPVLPSVFVSKVNALFRRLKPVDDKVITIGDFIIDADKFIVMHRGVETVLAKKEFELLYLLASAPGKVFLRNEILGQIWGENVIVVDRTIDVHVRKIRQKLGIDCITTVKGVGYKFDL